MTWPVYSVGKCAAAAASVSRTILGSFNADMRGVSARTKLQALMEESRLGLDVSVIECPPG
jgi:Mrp family chromosome partitioning ATPase